MGLGMMSAPKAGMKGPGLYFVHSLASRVLLGSGTGAEKWRHWVGRSMKHMHVVKVRY